MSGRTPTEELPPIPTRFVAARSRCLVVGPNRLLCELLAAELESSTGERWGVVERLGEVLPAAPDASQRAPRRLILWEVQDIPPGQVSSEIGRCGALDLTVDALALLNLHQGAADAQASLDLGVRGLFYTSDSLARVRQGVEVLLGGQVWISPEALTARPDPESLPKGLPVPWNLMLTRREQEVLKLLVSGQSNQEIAEGLSISPHTAKTHLYRLYKKINVSSRLEAAIWYRTHITR